MFFLYITAEAIKFLNGNRAYISYFCFVPNKRSEEVITVTMQAVIVAFCCG